MKGHEKKKYSKAQVITMLTIAFLLVAGLSYGVVSVQNTFTSGTTISSSAVNANFRYLGDRMPGFRIVNPGPATITATGSPYQILGQTTFIAPADGYVKIKVTCTFARCYRADTTAVNWMYFGMSTASTYFWNYGLSEAYASDAGAYKYFNPTSLWYGSVIGGNSYTYYMMAYRDSSGVNTWYISTPLMTIEYFPSLI